MKYLYYNKNYNAEVTAETIKDSNTTFKFFNIMHTNFNTQIPNSLASVPIHCSAKQLTTRYICHPIILFAQAYIYQAVIVLVVFFCAMEVKIDDRACPDKISHLSVISTYFSLLWLCTFCLLHYYWYTV